MNQQRPRRDQRFERSWPGADLSHFSRPNLPDASRSRSAQSGNFTDASHCSTSFICARHSAGRTLGKAVVAFAEDLRKKAGIEALRLEVGRENQPAQSLYQTAGFKEDKRNLMTKWL